MQIVHIEDICARKAIYSEIPIELSEKMRSVLKCIGVSKFYSHQVQREYVEMVSSKLIVSHSIKYFLLLGSHRQSLYKLPFMAKMLLWLQ